MIRPLNALLVPATALVVLGVFASANFDRPPPTAPAMKQVVLPVQQVATPRITVAEFPRHFTGTFSWDGDTAADAQLLAMDVKTLSESDGLIAATGRGTYTTGTRNVNFTFRIEADPTTGEFTMWESNPDVDSGFVTEGRHEAKFTNSLDTVQARWIGDNGEKGRLSLKAADRSFRTVAAAKASPQQLPTGTRVDYRYRSGSDVCVTADNQPAMVHYKGWNKAGVFDSSWDRGRPATLSANRVIPGFAEAMRGMCEGDFVRVYIPASQAYKNAPGKPMGELVFDIEMVDVIGR